MSVEPPIRTNIDHARPSRPPDVDWLTGLSSRAAFSRLVTQADRDREQATIALLEIHDFGEVNRQFGHDAGDDLLRLVAARVGGEASTHVTAARLGGAEFALLNSRLVESPVKDWLRPVVSAIRAAIREWVQDQVEQLAEFVDEPEVAVGYATGDTGRIWAEASIALELAGSDRAAGAESIERIVGFDPGDHRITEMDRDRAADRAIIEAVLAGDLTAVGRQIDVVGRGEEQWQWLRLGACRPEPAMGTEPVNTESLAPSTGRRVEQWLIRQAGEIITNFESPLRLTVPIPAEVGSGQPFSRKLFPLLERNLIPPSRIGFEVDQGVLQSTEDRGRRLIAQLAEIGSSVTVANCGGGWGCWDYVADLPVRLIKPSQRLIDRAAASNQAAIRILRTMVENAEDSDRVLIAPFSALTDERLADLGFTYVERGRATPVVPRRTSLETTVETSALPSL